MPFPGLSDRQFILIGHNQHLHPVECPRPEKVHPEPWDKAEICRMAEPGHHGPGSRISNRTGNQSIDLLHVVLFEALQQQGFCGLRK
jgi:hypothetical protein